MKSGELIIGLTIGAAVGYLAGILTAPAKGSETLKKIEDQIVDTFDSLEEEVNSKKKTLKKSTKDTNVATDQVD